MAPTVPPAPPRLSMMICLPRFFVSTAVSGRANASVPPPLGNGTTIVTGLASASVALRMDQRCRQQRAGGQHEQAARQAAEGWRVDA